MPSSLEEERLVVDMKQEFHDSNETYGKRRLLQKLRKKGFNVGVAKVCSLMKKHGLKAVIPKAKHYYPDAGDECKYAPNHLDRNFDVDTVGTHFVGDITYLRTHQGWCYLACVLDLGSREIVGYALSKSPDTALTKAALDNAIKHTNANTKQLLFHSDQGCQYSSKAFREHLQLLGITQSMSRRGNCWDNAVMERFFRSFKTEHLNRAAIISITAAKLLADQYICFYNYQRLHSAIGYLTPYEKGLMMKNVA